MSVLKPRVRGPAFSGREVYKTVHVTMNAHHQIAALCKYLNMPRVEILSALIGKEFEAHKANLKT